MQTIDDPAITILARCDEVLERHRKSVMSTPMPLCRLCQTRMPCDAAQLARDLRNAVMALDAIVEIDDRGRIMGQAGRLAESVLTTIAGRGAAE